MNEIKLLPHNQEMVEKIEKAMVDGNRKIFYTEATGLGKSYIFMYLVHKYFRDKKVLYICPKYHIWYNMKDYKEFELIKDCVTMKCYADFNKIKDRHLGYDVIFIDEAHHLDTDVWGKNIITLADIMLVTNPNSYIFGFTATPYVDGKFIGDEYFETSVIGMDLFDAIDNKILQKINYAVAVKEDIELSEEEKSLAIKYNVDTTSMMVTDIVNQYSNINHWLAYFPFIDELEENIQYFEKYFPEYKIFIIHSEIENSDNILKEFENYNGKAILASVSMVLEGIHPKTVEGILLYRNVCTNNTFFQIIGRLGIMRPNTTPVCIDIYSSYDNLINEYKIINNTDSVRNIAGNKSMRNYLYIESNTYKFIELSEIIHGLRNNTVHEYRGYIWITNQDLSRQLGRHSNYVTDKIRRSGKSHEQIIDDYLNDNSRTYRGIRWTSDNMLGKLLGHDGGYILYHRRLGESYEEIIDYCLDNIMTEQSYRGITWKTNAELSRKLGKSKSYVRTHINNGKSHEQIIDNCLNDNSRTYRGIRWTSYMDLSQKLGKYIGYVGRHVNLGKTCEQLIDNYLDNIEIEQSYRGITWKTNAELSRKLGKYDQYISNRIKLGNTYEQIIDNWFNDQLNQNKTYRGITWKYDAELSRKLGKNPNYVKLNINAGKTHKEIIDYCLDKNEKSK